MFSLASQGWMFLQPNSTAVPTMLWFHGNAGTINHRLDNIHGLVRSMSINVCIPEYRGYGRSAGTASEAALRTDAEDVLSHLLDTSDGGLGGLIDPSRILVFGRSLGDLIPSVVPPLAPIARFSRNRWSTKSIIGSVRCPILFLSSGMDEVIPSSHVDELYKMANAEHKTLKRFKNAEHMNMYEQTGYYEFLSAWMARVLGSW
eukprot:m51a1_g11251 hypothetical protein (203) ;mRNA; f:40942-41782